MAAASPIPALAARFAELRGDLLSVAVALRDDDTAAGRSLRVSVNQILRETASPHARLQTLAVAAATARVELPAPRRSGFSEAGDHPLGSSAMGSARNP